MNYTEKKHAPELEGQSAYVWRFDDPAEAAAYLRANLRSVNGHEWDDRQRWWGGKESGEDAARYATTGNESLVPLAEKYLDKIAAGGIETARHEWEPSLCGAYPVVGDFLAGRPDCMRRRMEREGERAPVRVVVDTTSSAGIGADELERRGAAILAFIVALAQERAVELWQVTSLDAHGYRKNYGGLLVRCPTSPLNVGVCAHLLTSQAWTRGIGYGWLSQEARAEGGWPWGNPPDNTKAKERCARLARAALDMSPQDVYVDSIVLGDPLTSDPVGWINTTLARIREEAAAEA